jgi:hypothetical protein
MWITAAERVSVLPSGVRITTLSAPAGAPWSDAYVVLRSGAKRRLSRSRSWLSEKRTLRWQRLQSPS